MPHDPRATPSAQAGVRDPRIALAGSVGSSLRILRALLRHRARVVGVLGLAESAASGVSGYRRLDGVAAEAGVPYRDFARLDEPEVAAVLRSWAPDLLFVVGLSQLVRRELLDLPAVACVGFHPTRLPEGRGRAPIAWILLDGVPAAATFFVLEETADSGPILVQEPFDVAPEDHAAEVLESMEAAIDRALDRWLPELLAGRWSPVPQDEARASFYGRRTPADGLIDWRRPAREVVDLVRASSRPHPGAFTHLDGEKLVVWRAAVEPDLRYHGVPGRVVAVDPRRGALVPAGSGLVWLRETELAAEAGSGPPRLAVGVRLGLSAAEEVAELRRRLAVLEERCGKPAAGTAGGGGR